MNSHKEDKYHHNDLNSPSSTTCHPHVKFSRHDRSCQEDPHMFHSNHSFKSSQQHHRHNNMTIGSNSLASRSKRNKKLQSHGPRLPDFYSVIDHRLYSLGHWIGKQCGKVLFVGILLLITLCVGLKSLKLETSIDRLWVEEGGRVEQELKYIKSTLGEDIGSTDQLVIQTPRDVNANILYPDALLHHLEVMKTATELTVDMFEVTWRLKDVCLTPSIPSYEESHIERIIDMLMPCSIMTPLDCFWEGSKLLGPDVPVSVPGIASWNLKWTNLNPQQLMSMQMLSMDASSSSQIFSGSSFNLKSSFPNFFSFSQDIMKRAGITTGYQFKPCLDPLDEHCPSTALNKQSRSTPDVGSELTGGCYGFATKYMHWPEDLIVGGVKKNKTGHIVKANALQSVIQLMGEQAMFDYWAKDYKVHNIDWSLEKARAVLEAWQRKFASVVSKAVGMKADVKVKNKDGELRTEPQDFSSSSETNIEDRVIEGSNQYSYSLFTTTLLKDIMENFSITSYLKMTIGFLAVAAYVSLVCWSTSRFLSALFVGLSGVCLVSLSIFSSMGSCALLRLPINASTTQVTPFLSLGFGVFTMFMFISSFKDVVTRNKKNNSYSTVESMTGEVLSSVGKQVILISICGISSFLSAAILPMPALRLFVLQFAVILCIMTTTMLFVFPAILALDLKRRRSNRKDLFCCFDYSSEDDSDDSRERDLTRSPSIVSEKSANSQRSDNNSNLSDTESATCLHQESRVNNFVKSNPHDFLSLRYLTHSLLSVPLTRKPIQVVVIVFFTSLALFLMSYIPSVKDGLALTDIVPRDTVEHKFLDNQQRFFSFYHMFAVTEGNFEYPTNQRLLYDYHNSFTRIGKIIKNDDGGLPDFWLSVFRDWLLNLQGAYDRDFNLGLMNEEGWNKTHASDEGILAYKLLVQTGRNDYPIDKTLPSKVKLVDSHGIINPKAFYNYLSAWVSNDALAYYASQANLRPEPRDWLHVPSDTELKIPKSQPLIFAQMPFYINGMNSTEEIVNTVNEIRSICDKFSEKGLANFPSGIPFVFWEQYVRLPLFLAAAGGVSVALVFLTISVLLMNPVTAFVITCLLVGITAQVYGVMGFLDIRLSAVPVVVMIICFGIGTGFFVPLTVMFGKTDGKNRSARLIVALDSMSPALFHGIVCLLISTGMLFFSEFDFIVKYYFYILTTFIVMSSLYGLILYPVILAMFGPETELPIEVSVQVVDQSSKYVEHEDDYDDSPGAVRRMRHTSHRTTSSRSNRRGSLPSSHFSRKEHPRVQSDISLSTIPEERDSIANYQSSHERIVVEPEFVVETITTSSPVQTSVPTPTAQKQQSHYSHFQAQFVNPNVESPFPTTADSPLSTDYNRDSPMSDTTSSSGGMSRPNSAPVPGTSNQGGQAQFTHTFNPNVTWIPSMMQQPHHAPQTVTTKVTTTAKLKLELQGIPLRKTSYNEFK